MLFAAFEFFPIYRLELVQFCTVWVVLFFCRQILLIKVQEKFKSASHFYMSVWWHLSVSSWDTVYTLDTWTINRLQEATDILNFPEFVNSGSLGINPLYIYECNSRGSVYLTVCDIRFNLSSPYSCTFLVCICKNYPGVQAKVVYTYFRLFFTSLISILSMLIGVSLWGGMSDYQP